jgi:hypothetical protein
MLSELNQNIGKCRAAKYRATTTARKAGVTAIPSGLEKRLSSMVPEAKAAEKFISPARRPNFKFRQTFSDGAP